MKAIGSIALGRLLGETERNTASLILAPPRGTQQDTPFG
jgi:hypothetical protein